MISGVSGRVVGDGFPIPDGKESYNLPVVYPFADGSLYILFGSGGETVAGNLTCNIHQL